MSRIKYNRTFHLPWSLGATNDDKVLQDTSCFNGKRVVVTEKMDGENSTLTNEYYHARSVDSKDHPSRSWIKQLHAYIRGSIPTGWRVCGENLYAKHSIAYENLKSYFYCFSIWNEHNMCLSWEDTEEWCQLLEIPLVPRVGEIFTWDERGSPFYWATGSALSELFGSGREYEGYVVRNADSFHYDDFKNNVAKYVRKNHVTTSNHWMHQEVIPNKLEQVKDIHKFTI